MTESEKQELIDYRTEKLLKQHKANRVLYWIVLIMTLLTGGSAIYSLAQVHFRVGGNAGNVPQSDTDVRACHRLLKHSRVFSKKTQSAHSRFHRRHRLSLYLYPFYPRGDLSLLRSLHSLRQNFAYHGRRNHRVHRIFRRSSFTNLESKKVKLSPFFIVVFSFCFALSIEYIWELVEYAVDSVSYEIAGFAGASNMQRWKDGIVSMNPDGTYVTDAVRGSGLKDSMMDMLVNIIGAAVVCGIALVGLKLRPDWFEGKRLMSVQKNPRIRPRKRGGNDGGGIFRRLCQDVLREEKKTDCIFGEI